ncbi:MAG: O-antigen polymerase [Pirellulales bacterium]|nr:O-antigen polymerase [Pirellulales bacterium]
MPAAAPSSRTDHAWPLPGFLHPWACVAWVSIPTILHTYWISRGNFHTLWNVQKHLGDWELAIILAAVACFGLGVFLSSGTRPRIVEQSERDHSAEALTLVFWLGWALVMLANAIWLAMAMKRGFSLAVVEENFGSDGGNVSYLKKEVFQTIPGVTTATQFAMSAAVMAVYLYWRRGEFRYVLALGCIILTTLARSFLRAERLALIETVVPAIIMAVWLAYRVNSTMTVSRDRWIRYSPALFLVLGITAFGFFEYFRSWKFYKAEQRSFTQFVLDRFTGYYATSINNGAMVINHHKSLQYRLPLPYTTWYFFWNFPLVDATIGYEKLTRIDPFENWMNHLELHGNVEYNTECGWVYPMIDYGIFGGWLAWIAIGYGVGWVYRYFDAGHMYALLLYPLFWVCFLDFPRTFLITSGRFLPSYLLIALFAIVWNWQRWGLHSGRYAPAPTIA